MTSYGHQAAPHPGSRHGPHGGYAPQVMPAQGAPAGTFSPGTKIQVGSHRVVIQKYLSEGGFAHVYVVKLSSPVDGKDLAVLKRVAVPDKDSLRGMRTEVETMKRLKGHRPIVTYIDSHASELRGGGYEVFLLMEYCDGGSLIDFMNTRLQHRLTEPEILHIFADVAEGVACMHYLKPPLLHRDLKVENVLIVNRGSSKRFKVCDFGSTAPPRPAPTTVVECRLMDEDVQKHTTLQYRAPEMVDVYRKQPLDEKSDIWALGVFLYKLCYYTTPFEDQGQLAILNASFKYPSHPAFSDKLKKLIGSMLRENMQSRPNIYQVIKEACDMQGREVPIHDIYSGQAQRESHTISKSSPTKAQEPRQGAIVGAVYAPPAEEKPNLPDIVPMRRGRPAASPGPKKQAPSASKVTDGDPFAALDSTSSRKVAEADELSSRFPTLDQFSLLHDKGAKFNFEASAASPQFQSTPTNQDLAERLADEVFASSLVGSERPTPSPRPNSVTPTMQQGQHDPSPPAERPLSKIPSAPAKAEHTQPTPTSSTVRNSHDLKTISSKPGSKYVSTGTMTSDFSSKASPPRADVRHGESLPQRNSFKASPDVLPIHARPPHLRRPSLSSRPSLEDNRRQAQVSDPALASNVHNVRPRPASTSFESSTLDFLREKELARPQKTSTPPMSQTSQRPQNPRSQLRVESKTSRAQVEDDMLIDIVDSGLMAQSKQVDLSKRMTVSTAPVPKKLPKRLGDAVSRFEGASRQDITDVTRPKQPQQDVTPSDPAPGYNSNPASDPSTNTLIDIDEDTKTPEMRRELERQKLEEEEKRVAAAQAEYRNRITSSGKPVPGPKNVSGPPRTASTIQNRMQSLLNEEQKPTVVHRTAQGYGKYTDDPSTAPTQKVLPSIPRKPIGTKSRVDVPSNGTGSSTSTAPTVTSSYSAPVSAPKPIGPKPPAPKKKPTHLNSFPTGARPPSPIKQAWRAQPEYLVAVDLPGQPALEMSSQEKADYIEDFTKRFPSLSSIETDTQASRASGGSRQW